MSLRILHGDILRLRVCCIDKMPRLLYTFHITVALFDGLPAGTVRAREK